MQKSKFDGIVVTLASVDDIAQWSHGAVDNPDTVNYRTGRPKQHGLFCETIFGPVKNYECSCGKYKGQRYKGIVCERCGVEVTTSRVRRSRMGHVDLASPVVHAWYKASPSGGIHQLLQLSSNEIDRILTFVKYAVPEDVKEEKKEELVVKLEETLGEKQEELENLYNAEKKELQEAEELLVERDELGKKYEELNKIKEKYEKKKKEIESDIADIEKKLSDDKDLKKVIDNLLKFRESYYKDHKEEIEDLKEKDEEYRGYWDTFDDICKKFTNSCSFYTERQKETLSDISFSDYPEIKAVTSKIPFTKEIANYLINLSYIISKKYAKIKKDEKNKIIEIVKKADNKLLKDIQELQKELDKEQKKLEGNPEYKKANEERKGVKTRLGEVENRLSERGIKNSSDIQKKLKEVEKLYLQNKEALITEFNRLKSIVSDLHFASTILESDYRNIFYRYSDIIKFVSGPDGILKMLQNIEVKEEIKKRLEEYSKLKSLDQKKKMMSLIKLLINLYVSGVKPENMVLRKLPVIPPDLRPVVQLDGGKFASSDVNLYYRRVLMRNIRLRKMIQVNMPDVVKKNEIRLLQESVNNLLVGERGGASKGGAGVKVFKSLSDMLSGKEGIFRKNLLGKRVDYSGRSIITVGPTLKLDECGLPIYIAVKMFTPFIIGKLIDKKIVYTPKQAEKLIKDESPIALKFLEEVIKDKYVLLNRAPTLHRLSIEAFKIKLMTGKTIRLHPLVCPAFNADFDGDQMAVHLPLSEEAQKEAREIIAADKNILRPGSGEPTITHSQDMVLGIYYLTDGFDKRYPDYNTDTEWAEKTPIVGYFESMPQVLKAFDNGDLTEKDKIVLKHNGEIITTTVGRVIFNSILPDKISFVNKKQGKKDLKKLLSKIFDTYDMATTVRVADAIKDLGFHYATWAANSVNITDMKVPMEKYDILKGGEEDANKIYNYFHKGFFSDSEKHRLVIEVWTKVKKDVEVKLQGIIGPGNDLYSMVDSGARGSQTHMTQISGMKGLVVDPKGEIIELPIKGSFVEGLKPTEYFISAHSGRKGKADTALRTAESGYLTRKLCDSSQEVVVRTDDCGTDKYIYFTKEEAELTGENFEEVINGRVLAKDVKDSNGTVILKEGEMINKDNINYILEDKGIEGIYYRSPLTCMCPSGVCQKCYGMDLATRDKVKVGVPVGIIAAQSIGEPATQLTMQTFHHGGVAGGEDMSQGIDRIKQLFEMRAPKKPAVVAPFDGTVHFYEKGADQYVSIESDYIKKLYTLKDGYNITVKKGDKLKKGSHYAVKGTSQIKVHEDGTVIEVRKDGIVLGDKKTWKQSYKGLTLIEDKEKIEGKPVYKGQILTNGALDVASYMEAMGVLQAQKYIIREVKKVYSDQGQGLNDRHIEVVVKQLFSKVFIEKPGESGFIPGTYVKYEDYEKINKELEAQGKMQAEGKRLALGLTSIAKEADSWLSAASFQETIRVMVGASLRGAVDTLSDLKSNVIIGRLLPVGEHYRKENGFE